MIYTFLKFGRDLNGKKKGVTKSRKSSYIYIYIWKMLNYKGYF